MTLNHILLAVVVVVATGCGGVNKATIAGTATGPKQIFINFQDDPLLIGIELKTQLTSQGYEVALNTEESEQAVVQNTSSGSVIYKRVSNSTFRYELTLGYVPAGGRILSIAASLRDREQNTLLGTYRWSWDKLFAAPTIDAAIAMIDENLLAKVFRDDRSGR